MRGTPFIRLFLLALFLAGATYLVAKVTSRKPTVTEIVATVPTHAEGQLLTAYVEGTLSSPAESVRFLVDGSERAPSPALKPSTLTFDQEFPLELTATGETMAQVSVVWNTPTQSNFLLLSIEPDGLETKEVTLHFPPEVTTVPLNLTWPSAATP